MSHTMRFAISLPDGIARQIEHLRKETGETRSAFILKAIRRVLEERKHAKDIEAYIEGYRRHPETPADRLLSGTQVAEIIAKDPWD